ncbi:hypothetical protein [Segatella bryantii]|uniref:hypothetical protein n=1 Tax=Segatella bryantii TaxID=77095 RepID=UPI00242FADBC|nr:hypothetical protein [Segatella bryantii]
MYEIMWADNIKSVPKNSTFEGILYRATDLTPCRKWDVPKATNSQFNFIVYNPHTGKEVKLTSLEEYSLNNPYHPTIDVSDDNVGWISFRMKNMKKVMSDNVYYFYHFRGIEKDTLCVVNIYFTVRIKYVIPLYYYYIGDSGEEVRSDTVWFRLYDQQYYDRESDKVKTLPKTNPYGFYYKPKDTDIKNIKSVSVTNGPYERHKLEIEDKNNGKIITDMVTITTTNIEPTEEPYTYTVNAIDADDVEYSGSVPYMVDTRKTTSFNAFVLHNGTGDMAFDDVDTSDDMDDRIRSSNIVNMDGTEELLLSSFELIDDTDGLGAECRIGSNIPSGSSYGTWTLSVDYNNCPKGISKLMFSGQDRYGNTRVLKLATVIK